MSTIGGTTAAGLNLASSIVGSSRPEAVSDQGKALSADHKAQIDRDAAIKESPDDVADAQFGTDRDADGRQLYRRRQPDTAEPTEDAILDESVGSALSPTRSHATDAFGDRGNALDIDA
jgi:hypothetical protein